MFNILIIFNTISVIFLFCMLKGYTLNYTVNKTFNFGIVTGYQLYFRDRYLFSIPIRNEKRANLRDTKEMLKLKNPQAQRQTICALISWKDTPDEVHKFYDEFKDVVSFNMSEIVRERLDYIARKEDQTSTSE